MALALEQRVPLPQLIRMELRGWTTARLAAELGVTAAAVEWRLAHLDPWSEARLVRLEQAG